MASHLANIFGTEQDKVNCPFYFKIGACRHGEKCSRIHNKPSYSETLLIKGIYANPKAQVDNDGRPLMSEEEIEDDFNDFYSDVYEELVKFGPIEELHVCDNLSDHMLGNMYVRYEDEVASANALESLQGRFYEGKPLIVEYSPVTDFREARCRQYEKSQCMRGGTCNFLHLRRVGRRLEKELFGDRDSRRNRRSRSRSRSRERYRDRDRDDYRRKRRRRRTRSRSRSRDRTRRRRDSRRRHSRSRSRGSRHSGESRDHSSEGMKQTAETQQLEENKENPVHSGDVNGEPDISGEKVVETKLE